MSTQQNLLNDVGTLLKIPNKAMTELADKSALCISSIIADAKLEGESAVVIGIGIGTLSIDLLDMQCKFIPNKGLKEAIKRGLAGGIDPLELALDQALIEKLMSVCEEVLPS